MSKLVKSIFLTFISAAVATVFVTLFLYGIELFFDGYESLENITATEIISVYKEKFIIIFSAFIIISIFNRVNIGKPENTLSKKQISGFTKAVIYVFGLPVLGAILSMIIVRCFNILGFSFNETYIVILTIFFVWVVGAYLCKTVYFKNNV